MMSPQPDVLDVQKYVGTCLISSQKSRSRCKSDNGNNNNSSTCNKPRTGSGSRNGRYQNQRPISQQQQQQTRPLMTVCECCGSCRYGVQQTTPSAVHNLPWTTGVPLISLTASNSKKQVNSINNSNNNNKSGSKSQRHQRSTWNVDGRTTAWMDGEVACRSPMSELAIHTQGIPLIIPDHVTQQQHHHHHHHHHQNGYGRNLMYFGGPGSTTTMSAVSPTSRAFIRDFKEGLGISDGGGAKSMYVKSAYADTGYYYYYGGRIFKPALVPPQQHQQPMFVIGHGELRTPETDCSEVSSSSSSSSSSSTSSSPAAGRSPINSDCMSVTSEGSSECSLPRILKPRKRRKRDRKLSALERLESDETGNGIVELESVVAPSSSRTLVTLQPYMPLCYRYDDEDEDEDEKDGVQTPPSSSVSSLSPPPPPLPQLSPSSSLQITTSGSSSPSPYPTPPLSPSADDDGVRRNRRWSSACDVETRIVTSARDGTRDLEIHFFPTGKTPCTTSGADDVRFPSDEKKKKTKIREMASETRPEPLTSTEPPDREWINLSGHTRTHPVCVFTVMCYNVLCDKYATRQMYGYCPNWALNWEYRRKAIIGEIRHMNADIITLQEVETEQFYNFFLPELKSDGYDGIFSPKSRAKTMNENDRKFVDGCAIFYRTHKFRLIKEHLMEFTQLAMANADGSDDMLNRVMTKDNIGLAALLETKEGAWINGTPDPAHVQQPLLVCTAHIHWDPEFCDVKIIQMMMLMNELRNIVEDSAQSFRPGSHKPDSNAIPLLLCGDFNSLPDSGVIEFLTSGRISSSHPDFKELSYKGCLQKISSSEKQNEFTHSFKISRAYSNDMMPFTNYTYDFKGAIDYILYSDQHMVPLGLLGPLDPDWLREQKVVGCPHPYIPSDHFSLLVEFEMSPAVQHLHVSNGILRR